MMYPEKTSAERFRLYMPGALLAVGTGPAWTDVLVEILAHRRVEGSFLVPAVAEPLIVLVLSGQARVEERELGAPWTGRNIRAGEFFLTTTPTPYELRWQVTGPGNFEVLHAYVGLPVFARASQEVLGMAATVPRLREVSGGRDPVLSALLQQLRCELSSRSCHSPLFVQGIVQSLAVHLVRTYGASAGAERRLRGGLPAFRLRKVAALLEAHLAEDIPLARLAHEAGYSACHFSRLFKKATGFSPSQYLIRLRVAHARRLLRETTQTMIEVGLEVGYRNPSHFAQIFRREVGITPSQYRGAG